MSSLLSTLPSLLPRENYRTTYDLRIASSTRLGAYRSVPACADVPDDAPFHGAGAGGGAGAGCVPFYARGRPGRLHPAPPAAGRLHITSTNTIQYNYIYDNDTGLFDHENGKKSVA